MFWASYLLAVLAIVLAWPVPVLLSRAQWPARSPFTAMILWQAIALAGGLSMIGAMLVYGLELSLLASPSAEGTGTLVISHNSPVAYCLPGGARSVTVLSDGLMAALEPAELRAVLIHENAHLSQRHHLLLWAFAAWRQALPWLPTTRLAQESVNSLIEMLADDVALKTESKATLIKAIAIVASGSAGNTGGAELRQEVSSLALSGLDAAAGTSGADSARTTASRVSRLLSPRPELPAPVRSMVMAGSVLLLALPTALLVVPGLLG